MSSKVSSRLDEKLRALGPTEKINTVVVLGRYPKDASQVVKELQEVAAKHGGKVLGKEPDLLGTIPVTATAKAVRAISKLRFVEGILEDQPIRSVE